MLHSIKKALSTVINPYRLKNHTVIYAPFQSSDEYVAMFLPTDAVVVRV